MTLKPIGLAYSTALFVIPGLVTALLYTFGFDYVQTLGYSASNAMMLVAAASFVMLFVQFAILYTAEGNAWSFDALATRLRFRRMTGWQWFWTFIVFLFVTGAYLGIFYLGVVQAYASVFPLPDWYRAVPGDVVGVYWLIGARLGLLLINVMAEELLWRGFILPRQEITHGRWTFLIHGVQWTLYHIMKPWEMLMLLPGCIAYAILATWSKNIVPGIMVHFLFNGLGVVLLTLAVFGIIG